MISMYDKNHPAPDSAQLTGSFSTTDEDLALETDRKPAEVVAVGVKGSVLQRHVVYHQVGTISNIKKYVADSQPEKKPMAWRNASFSFATPIVIFMFHMCASSAGTKEGVPTDHPHPTRIG